MKLKSPWFRSLPDQRGIQRCQRNLLATYGIMTCGRGAITTRPMMGDRNTAAAAVINTAMAPPTVTPVRRPAGPATRSEFGWTALSPN